MLTITEAKSRISKLSDASRIILELCAYFTTTKIIDSVETLAAFHLTSKKVKVCVSELLSQGFLEEWFYRYNINPDYILPTLIFIAEKHHDDARKMNALIVSYSKQYYGIEAREDLYNAIRYALGYDTKPTTAIEYSSINKYIPYIYEEPFFPKLIACLKPIDQETALCYVVDYATMFDIVIPSSRFDYIANNLIDADTRVVAMDLFAYYKFVCDGTRIEKPKDIKTRAYCMMQLAMQASVDGEYTEAILYFTNSLKLLNKDQYIKNVFFFFVAQYYYIMCLIRENSDASKKKLDQYLRKKEIEKYANQLVTLALANSAVAPTRKPTECSINGLITLSNDGRAIKNCNLFGAMLAKYFDIPNPKANKILKDPEAVASLLLIRHELSQYLTLTEEQKAQLLQLYGDKPILTSLKKEEEWEWVINEVMKKVQASDTPKTTNSKEKTERLIYIIDDGRNAVMMQYQTILKSGKWSVPKNITRKKIESLDLTKLEDCDKDYLAAFNKLNNYTYYLEWPKTWDVLSFLTECGRVFTSDYMGNITPVKFEEEKANLWIKRRNDGNYTVDSNLSLDELKAVVAEKFVFKNEKNIYTVINVSDTAKAILENILRIKTFPASAESNLRKMLPHIEEFVEVKSPLFDAKSIQSVKGSTMIHARITPSSNLTYKLNFEMKPLADGSVYVFPGDGKAVIYDASGDKTYRVKRNLKDEAKAYSDFIDDIGFIDTDESENGFTFILHTEYILELMDYASSHPEDIVIEWAEGKGLSVARPASSAWNIGLKSHNDWFEVEGNVKIDEKTVMSISSIFELMSQSKGKYIKLNDNEYLEINQKLRKQLDRIEALSMKNRNKTVISQFNAALIDDKALDGELKVTFDKKLANLRKNVADTNNYYAEVPSQLQATLRPYQVEGYQWMARLAKWGAGACLADDMGLGKTVETIAFLLLKASEGPAMVVAPASVVPNWANEISRFAPTLNTYVLNSASDRKKLIEDMDTYDVVISTYGILTTEQEALSAKKWTTICLDEAHTIKNKDTKMSHAVMSFTADYRIILTGTPIQNHLGELWNLFRFINPGLLGSDESFRHRFVNPIQNGDKERQRILQRIIRPFMLRRTKNEVVDDLPEKTEIVMPVELSDAELAMYEAMRQKAVEVVKESNKVDVNTLAEITKLRRAACSIKLADNNWSGANSKVDTLVGLAEEINGTPNRMLVFSQFTSFFAIVRKALDKAGIKYLYLDGSTSLKEREKLVKKFREGNTPLFLISLKAGGLGLNLPDANYVVHLDPWWNPAIEQQATDRAYRIGQKRNVTVYHLISKNTIEEKIRRLHRTKRDLADSLLEGTDMASKLTISEIMDMVSEK